MRGESDQFPVKDDDQIRQLLIAADIAPPMPSAAAMAGRVRAAAWRRILRTRVVTAALITVLASAVWLNARRVQQVPPEVAQQPGRLPTKPTDAAPAKPSVPAKAFVNIAEKERLVTALLVSERRRALAARLATAPEAVFELKGRREEAAGIGLGCARSLERINPAAARQQYHRIIDLYPDSVVAVVATGELARLAADKGAMP